MADRRADADRIVATLEAEPATPWGAMGLAIVHVGLGNEADA